MSVIIHYLGAPSSLEVLVDDEVTLSWSQSEVSQGYEGTTKLQYNVKAFNTFHVCSLLTSDLEVKRTLLQTACSIDLCTTSQYKWSVAAVVGEKSSVAVESDKKFVGSSGMNVHYL